METQAILVPLLVVRRASDALDFYVRALGARVTARYEHGPERHVGHAELDALGFSFAVTEEARAWNSDAPPSLGGSPVVLQLIVENAELVYASLLLHGATGVFPLQQFLGERMGRVRDPFGHLWLLRERVEELSREEIQRQRDALYARFAADAPDAAPAQGITRIPKAEAHVHLVVGPVGAGKSTFAGRLAREQRLVYLSLDEWMVTLFRPDRPGDGVVEWYMERAERAVQQIWLVARRILERGTGVALELGLLRRSERERFYARARDAGFGVTVHVLDAPRDVRRERVERRNHEKGATFSMVVPPAVFELASDLWEAPDTEECEGRDVRFRE
jgi:uncharacterized glyoxalase superfamily protein PhnB/predicted kinase